MARFGFWFSAGSFAALCLLNVALMAGTARAQEATFAQSLLLGGVWEHNGSVMYTSVLEISGEAAEFEINYATPSPALAKQGVTNGTVVFRGRLQGGNGNKVVGRAFAFRKGCSAAAYDVSGVLSEPRRGREAFIQLLGSAPLRASSGCGINGYSDATSNAMLMFEYKGASE